MIRSRLHGALCVFALLALTSFALGQPAPAADPPAPRVDDPDAVALLEKVVTALGGSESLRKTANAKWVFTLKSLPARAERAPAGDAGPGARVRLVILTRSDGARCITRDIGGERQLLGMLGDDGWMTHLTGEVLDLPPSLRREFVRDHQIETMLYDYARHGWVVRRVPAVGDAPSIEWVPREGRVEAGRVQVVLDPNTHRPRSISYAIPTPKSEPATAEREDRETSPEPTPPSSGPTAAAKAKAKATVTVHFESYRTVDGVSIPHRRRLELDGKPVGTLELDDVTIGLETPDHAFRRPRH